MQGCAGGTVEWGKAWNVQGDVSSHTSCSGSVSYPAVGYYVFMWEGRNKTDFTAQDRGLSDDGDHIYCCVVCFSTQHSCTVTHCGTHVHSPLRHAYIRQPYRAKAHPYKLYHTHFFFFTNTLTGVQTYTHHQLPKLPTLEESVSQQGDYKEVENSPSTVLPRKEACWQDRL